MTLRTEILALPAELRATRDTAAITAALNAARPRVAAEVNAAAIRGALYAMRVWPVIVKRRNAAAANADPSTEAIVCQQLYDLAISQQPIPMDNPAIAAAVNADLDVLEAAEIIAAEQRAAVLALATRADPVSEPEVRAACYDADGRVWEV